MSGATSKFRVGLICFLLGVVTFAVYWPAHRFDFVNYDDPVYVSENPNVHGGLSVEAAKWAFVSVHSSNWHPLTWLSHMLDVQLSGLHAGPHHLVNALLHAANSALLFLVLFTMTGASARSFFVAALFAWHPLHVESVAWISERKDVLSTLFGLLALWAYVGYARMSSERRSKATVLYFLSLVCYVLALLSKPMMVTLPFVMILLDFWPLQRVKLSTPGIELARIPRLFWEKIPFFALTLAACVVTFLAQKKGGAVATLDYMPVAARLTNAIVAYGHYLKTTVWPVDLAVFYPHPGSWPAATVWSASLFLLVITAGVLWQTTRRPYLLVGWFWYLGTLIPVIGLVQVGDQAYADRYTYLPLIGIFVGITWALGDWAANAAGKRIALGAVAAVVALACIMATRMQLQYWRNSETLFRRALAVTKDNYVAFNNLGNILSKDGKLEEAKVQFIAALAALPSFEDAHLNLGRLLNQQGDATGAIAHFTLAVAFKPESPEGHYNLGTVLASEKRYQEAILSYEQALALNPNHTNAHYNLGIALTKLGRLREAEIHFRTTIKLDPKSGFGHYNLGLVLIGMDRLEEACEHFRQAIRLSPDFLPARIELGGALLASEQFEKAVALYRDVLQADPDSPPAHNNLGLALARLGQPDAAGKQFAEVVRLEPQNADAHYNLANALSEQGKLKEAITNYAEALRLNPKDERTRQKLARLTGRKPDASP